MAYIAFDETTLFAPEAPVAFRTPTRSGFSALEWSVIALARRDGLGTLRQPGRVAMAMGAVFGERPNPRLADPRLEALRRMAVLSWHYGYVVPGDEVRAFLDAGFEPDQYERMVDSISIGRNDSRQRRSRFGFA